MSQAETINFLELERKKHFEFFLPYYRTRNWQVTHDNIDTRTKNDWDVRVEHYVGQYKTIDEKVRTRDYDDCLIEIIQDLKTCTPGWYYGNKDWVLYGSWNDIERAYPSSLYLIKMPELRAYIDSLSGFFEICSSKRGWGNTWNLVHSWTDLINKRIVERLV